MNEHFRHKALADQPQAEAGAGKGLRTNVLRQMVDAKTADVRNISVEIPQ